MSQILLAVILTPLLLTADGEAPRSPESLVQAYCFRCHDQDTGKGDIDLESTLESSPLVRHKDTWVNVMERLKNHDMPPEGKPQPTPGERKRLLAWLDQEINHFDYSQIDNPGYEPVRRLTHVEFNHAIRDLFGMDLNLTEDFPIDLSGTSGFDNSANTLFLQPALFERYVAVVDKIIALALPETPKTDEQRAARKRIFVSEPSEDVSEEEAAMTILRRFLKRAYRRPLAEEELDLALATFQTARKAGKDFEGAIKKALSAALLSPNFLLKIESSRDTDQAYRVNDWELANRLSFFLWASIPDERLADLAERGQLHEDSTLRKQVERMLADPKADALGQVFAAQWLGYDDLGVRIRLDPIDNPWCTESLMDAMKAESSLFFVSLLRENQPLHRLIDADYTYLNEELAEHYDLEGIQGEQMRRVALSNAQRGGILGQGSIHAVTSFPHRTSPVVRGKWILETLLGTPPPPPPPNVSEFSDEIEDQEELSERQKLELHRKNPNCYGCHSKMDPLGFSLQHYDWFGRWRDEIDDKPVDARGELPDGTTFTGATGLRRIIIERRFNDLARQITRKMLSYGLGRQLEYYDERAVRQIVSQLEADGYRFHSLILGIVRSYPFQYNKVPDADN